MKVIAVANIKGGVGKTTLSVMLSRFLAYRGKRVLLIDADPQGTASLHATKELEWDENGYLIRGLHRLVEVIIAGLEPTENVVRENMYAIVDPMDEAFYLLPNCLESSDYDLKVRTTGRSSF
nr:ParA family protein [Desulfurobacterium sp.]